MPGCLSGCELPEPLPGKQRRDVQVPLKPQWLSAGWIHVDGFTAIAPARRYRNGEAYILTAEFFFASSGFGHTRDTGIGNDTLDGSSAGMAQLLVQQCGRSFRHLIVFILNNSRTPMPRPSITTDTNFGKLIFFITDSSLYLENMFKLVAV